jgi:hypothetical protein
LNAGLIQDILISMSLAELKKNVLALPAQERYELVLWLNRLEAGTTDVPGEALDHLAAEIWDQDDRHAPPTHPTR